MYYFKISFNKTEKKSNQIAAAIKQEIDNGFIAPGDQLPSINKCSQHYKIARDTVEKAYCILKEQGIIISVPGKGYFIGKAQIPAQKKLIAVFDINKQAKLLYNNLIQYFQNTTDIDIKLYYYDTVSLNELIENGSRIY